MARSRLVQLLVTCPDCQGARSAGCSRCNGFGRLAGLCSACGGPAFHRTTTTILCPHCYFLCEMCRLPTFDNDRLPAGIPHSFIHAFCAVARQILENAVVPDNTVERARARALVPASARTSARTEVEPMPKPSPQVIARMREAGYVSTAEAAELTGHGLSTIYEWIAADRLPGSTRSGVLHFVPLDVLLRVCPQARRAAVSQ